MNGDIVVVSYIYRACCALTLPRNATIAMFKNEFRIKHSIRQSLGVEVRSFLEEEIIPDECYIVQDLRVRVKIIDPKKEKRRCWKQKYRDLEFRYRDLEQRYRLLKGEKEELSIVLKKTRGKIIHSSYETCDNK